jgi:hypothetical protein
MKKETKVALKTLAMKARVYNYIRKELYKKKIEDISAEEKIILFDTIFAMNKESHWELNFYKEKRQTKAERDRLREQRKINLVNTK